MSEKPEALRFEVWRDRETEILRVTNSGKFIWNENADQMMRDPVSNPSIIHVLRALRRAEAVQAENERLRGLLRDTTFHLGAAVDLLKRGGRKAVASNKMFGQMLADYTNSFERGRAALRREDV